MPVGQTFADPRLPEHVTMTEHAAQTLVSLTFDDGLDAHLDAAMPMLEAHGMRGTFYVSPGAEPFAKRSGEWIAAAQRGHELGNHTVFHPGVSSKPWVTEGIALDTYSLDRMRTQLLAPNRILQILDGRTSRSFAFPCSNPNLGKPGLPRRLLTRLGWDRTRLMGFVDRHNLDIGSRLVDYTPLVREIFPSARCGGVATKDLPTRPDDWHRVRGIDGDGASVATLDAALDQAIARKAFAAFVFHGVGGGHHLSVGQDVLEHLLRRLSREQSVQVLPFLEATQVLQLEPSQR